MKLAEISIKRPSLIIVLLSLLIIGGLYSYSNLSYELIPKIDSKVLTVSTVYPGASPAEVENTLTKKVEDAVSSLENIKKIQSRSYESLSVVIIEFDSQADIDYALNDAQRRINAIRSDLPTDAKEPSLSKFSLSDLPIITIGVTAGLSETQLYDVVDQKIKPTFSRIHGVASVSVIGGQEREIRVSLDPNKVMAYGLSIPQVQQIIASSNMDFPTGNLKTRDNTTLIRLSGNISSVGQLRNLTLASKNGVNIKLSDVADVQDTEKEVEKIARIDQKSTLLLQIQKQSDANAVEVSKGVKVKIKDLEKQFSSDHVLFNLADDSSIFTLEAADAVIHDLFLAVLLVAFVMLFFLHSLRNALIVMVSIPSSLIATFIGILVFGFSLNLMSLLALSLVVGILVDDAIVVIENMHRHLEMGKGKVRAAYDGASEIGFTVTAITMVIVVVFLPIAISTGLVANIIKQFCVVVIISTLFSLLVSFTAVPWLYSRFGKLEPISKDSFIGKIIFGFEHLLDRFTLWISDLLLWCLKNKFVTLIVALILFLSSFLLVRLGFIGSDFFPASDRGKFMVQLELNKDASLEQTNFATQKAERFITKYPEVESTIASVGQTSSGMVATQSTAYKSEISVELIDKSKRKETAKVFAAKLKRSLEKELIGVKINTIPIGIMGAEEAAIQMVVTGNSLEDAMKYAKEAERLLKSVEGSNQVDLSVKDGSPEISISVDRDRMTSLGLNVAIVGQTLRTAFSGNTDSKFRTGNREYDINIILDDAFRADIDDVRNVAFLNASGQEIKLSQFAEVKYSSGASVLERTNRSPSVTVKSQTVGKTAGEVAGEWTKKLEKIKKPAGVEWEWSGNLSNQEEGFGTLGVALLAALILVYMIMVILYDDFLRPFVVMFSIPLSFIGAFWGLALTDKSLNIFTILGMIMLVGLVAKNAILLVDYANQRKKEGESTFDALIQANHSRLRPILMTTVAMVFGMIPIAMASGEASSMNQGLAIVIIGGLISSLLLTLVIVPVVYAIMVGFEERFLGVYKKDYDALMREDYNKVSHDS
ncbi:MAG: efflux RND transporter permease subunit [Bergeyella sp.]|nr:efflux RND transporter permease subunit [Bergeyella sp.]